ncbi:hypothetical protein BATDEDRAFT_88457 [Batrachochytrium dendrobatidis JAM81]|uniref:Uncharacterized protein n=1 Tax=Batrachochytrium dendrobatidis (strain JAM81 / FGSC 10211) TaxID=684364 RepID=F4P286_BATDJ|nr:uncharacterized protein BATDEDRAFT_88457 [Batrachochytrium dendrobatidis JAM81]EGF80812.1 hypothetical protein BATDEDRAFT_88457 [Batrachochytrium dendrobatidis JAM81]|eukprot:XP_006678708.1 hypothetical protein BATDEDRAFT_88457 [Batrachochytrium dendrobatidis JAM81]
MMKLLIAVLSSTLIACSVTTATPVNPSRTRNLESSSTAIYTATAYPSTSTFTGLDVDTVNCGDYSRRKKQIIKEYAKRRGGFKATHKKCKLIKAKVVAQKPVIKNLRERIKLMSPVTMPNDGGPDYTETKSLLQSGNAVLANLESQRRVCDDQYFSRRKKMRLAKRKLAEEFFGIFRVELGLVTSRRMITLLSSQIFLNCFNQFYSGIRSSSTGSERASTSGTQGSSRSHGPPPSYEVVMKNPKLYKVTQQNPGDQLPSYQEVIRNPQNFPKVLEDPDVTESSSMNPSIVHSTQTSSSVPPSQHTASSTLQRVSSTLQRASSSLRRAASSVRKVSSSLTWKVDRS